MFYKKADGIILVYDITNKYTFEGVQRWMNNINNNAKDKVPIILLGNKADLDKNRQV